MSTQALKLIQDCIATQDQYLDLGNCGLTDKDMAAGTSIDIQLRRCSTHLKTLILSNEWYETDANGKITDKVSKNAGAENKFDTPPPALITLTGLQKLVCGGGYHNPWGIRDMHFVVILNALTCLNLNSNQITELKGLDNLTLLQSLDISENQIAELKGLDNLTLLQSLDIRDNRIAELKGLDNLIQLQSLNISYNQIAELKGLDNLTQLQSLDISSNEIAELKGLDNLTQLQSLDISENQIKKLKGLDSLMALNTFNISRNQIVELEGLDKFTALKSLEISNNQIAELKGLHNMTALKKLDIFSNNITQIKGLDNLLELNSLNIINNQITELKGLGNLLELNSLHLSLNKILELKGLDNLTQLQSLHISNNKIAELKGLDNLTQLQSLHISSNQIAELKGLDNLTQLQSLHISSNQIAELKGLDNLTQLQSLHISSNQIAELKGLDNLTNIQSLKYLDLGKNRVLDKLPAEVAKVGWVAIKDWLKANQKNSGVNKLVLFKEIKLLLLGNTNTGKSNFLEYFETGKQPELNSSTHGIQFKVIDKYIDGVNINCWDFGGQEYFHATHKLFFSSGALHIVLWSQKDVQRYKEKPEECFDLNYWLRCIEQLNGRNERLEEVIITENKIDLNGFKAANTNQHYYEDKFSNLNQHFTSINLKPLKRLESFKELFNERAEVLYKELPAKYLRYLKFIRNEKKPFLLLNDIDKGDNKTADTAMQVFHAMGLLLYFPSIIPGKVFTNPQVLLDLLYNKVLSKEKKASISKEEIKKSIQNNPLKLKNEEVIKLLKDFDIVFEIPAEKDTYFIPQYLKPPPSFIDFFEKHQFQKANICITSDNYLMNLAMLKVFGKYGKHVKGDSKDEYLFWKDGIVIEKGGMLLLVKFNRSRQSIELFPDVRNRNFKLQNELVDFILDAPVDNLLNATLDLTKDEHLEMMMYQSGVKKKKSGNFLERYLYDPSLRKILKKQIEGINWTSEDFSVSVSLDGEYFTDWNKLTEQREKGIFRVEAVAVSVNPETNEPETKKKILSVFDYNLYLPVNKKGDMKKIFISYSKEDVRLVNKFIEHLSALKQDGKVAEWYCTELTAGSDWNHEIQSNFDASDIVCFMISSNFMKTKYVHEHEVKRAFERKEKEKDFKIVPIILDFCHWTTQSDNNLGQFTALPYMAKPVIDFKIENMAWYIVEECLRLMIEKDLDPTGNDFYNDEHKLPKDVLKIYERIAEGKVDNNTL